MSGLVSVDGSLAFEAEKGGFCPAGNDGKTCLPGSCFGGKGVLAFSGDGRPDEPPLLKVLRPRRIYETS